MVSKPPSNPKLPVRTIVASFIINNWPWLLSMLATAAQIIEKVLPWPVFFMVLAIILVLTFWLFELFEVWRDRRNLKDKIAFSAHQIHQSKDLDNPGFCKYQLIFHVFNVYPKTLYLRVNHCQWDIDGEGHKPPDVLVSQQMVPPGPTTLQTPTIGKLKHGNFYIGNFRVEIGIGKNFGRQEIIMEVDGSFRVTGKTEGPEDKNLPVTPKITRIEFSKVK